jgi:hypothetical protein
MSITTFLLHLLAWQIFVDADGSTHYYKESEFNAAGASWDLCLNKVQSVHAPSVFLLHGVHICACVPMAFVACPCLSPVLVLEQGRSPCWQLVCSLLLS